MSLISKYEFILNFVKFKNIDLYSQGGFYLTFHLSYENENKVIFLKIDSICYSIYNLK